MPNDGVLYYRWLFNEPRVLVTSPKALGEVLVHRSYEFVKPQRVRVGLGRLLGVGVLLAEGNEHKVTNELNEYNGVLLMRCSVKENFCHRLLHSDILRICIQFFGTKRRR